MDPVSAYSQAPTYPEHGLRGRVGSALSERSRRKRLRTFLELIGPQAGDRIIDIGCGPGSFLTGLGAEVQVTGVDLIPDPPAALQGSGRTYVQGDALALPFKDGEFDIAFSNSVIEHLAPDTWQRFASEVRRVARRYFVQTPNRHFPIEPHALLPLVQYLPPKPRAVAWRLSITRSPYEEITLLTADQLRELFPDASVLRERFGPLTKSLLAIRDY